MNASSAAHSYVSPATSDPASHPALRLCADGPTPGTGRHGGDRPPTAHVPLVHGGHLPGCVRFPLRADPR